MKLGDRVEIIGHLGANCAKVPFSGLTGATIAKAMNIDSGEPLWLVLFDRDICGLSVQSGCSHDFGAWAQKDSSLYTIVEGGIAPKRRNQRFILDKYLKLLNAPLFAPKNNDGRSACFWCGAPTKRMPGFANDNYDICTRCGK